MLKLEILLFAAVQDAEPDGSVKKGDVVKAVIVRQTKYLKRSDGT